MSPARRVWIASMAVLALAAPLPAQAQWSWWFKGPKDFAEVHQVIATRYPQVEQISTAELASLLARGEAPLLLDNRTRAEYDISHLPGAIWVKDLAATRAEIARARSMQPQRKVVMYCSVGYRSSVLIDQLLQQPDRGFSNGLYNLKGSIFQWANEGRPMVSKGSNGDQPAQQVHPYDARWAPLLRPSLRAAVH